MSKQVCQRFHECDEADHRCVTHDDGQGPGCFVRSEAEAKLTRLETWLEEQEVSLRSMSLREQVQLSSISQEWANRYAATCWLLRTISAVLEGR